MKSVRRPVVALSAMLVLVVDPGGRRPHRAARAGRLVGRAAAARRGRLAVRPLRGLRARAARRRLVGRGPRGRPVLDARRRRRARGDAGAGGGLPRHDVEPRDRRVGGRLRDREGGARGAHRRRVHPLVRRPTTRQSTRRIALAAGASIWLPGRAVRRGRAAARRAVVDRRGLRARGSRGAARPRRRSR